MDGRYQYLEDDGEGDCNEFRGLLNYKHDLCESFAVVVGAGYEYQKVDMTDDVGVEQQAILANVDRNDCFLPPSAIRMVSPTLRV